MGFEEYRLVVGITRFVVDVIAHGLNDGWFSIKNLGGDRFSADDLFSYSIYLPTIS
jgi:hypothetical protein